MDIPQPFRNNINSSEALKAQEACADLDRHLTTVLKPFFENLDNSHESRLGDIVANYVDNVVLPTYKLLKERNAAMLEAVRNLSGNRTDVSLRRRARHGYRRESRGRRARHSSSDPWMLSVLTRTWIVGLLIRMPLSII